MQRSIRKGLSFGLTSGIITTLGLIVGLSSGTHSKLVVIGGILVIAVADAMSDALGIHISEESEKRSSNRQVWIATASTMIFKFLFAMSFAVPVLLFQLSTAIIVSIIWGILLLSLLSLYIAREKNKSAIKTIFEHITIAIIVIVVTHFIGLWVATFA